MCGLNIKLYDQQRDQRASPFIAIQQYASTASPCGTDAALGLVLVGVEQMGMEKLESV